MDEVEAMATATLPAGVRRGVRDGVTIMRWIDHLEDDDDVARAAGRHERWMAGLTRVKRSAAYNALGDKGISPRKDDRPPFTFYDASKRTAYKAIVVDPSGAPDEDVWSEVGRSDRVSSDLGRTPPNGTARPKGGPATLRLLSRTWRQRRSALLPSV